MTFGALLNVILAAFVVGIVWSMVKIHRDPHYKQFNLVDMITAHDGKVSRPACLETGSWLVATWGFIVLINKDALSEWYMGAYIGAFVLRAAHAAYLGAQQGLPPSK